MLIDKKNKGQCGNQYQTPKKQSRSQNRRYQAQTKPYGNCKRNRILHRIILKQVHKYTRQSRSEEQVIFFN